MEEERDFSAKTKKWGVKFTELCNLMARLRAEDGCPWDRSQDHLSLRRYLLEEVYEFLEAVEESDSARMADELGDILLQVVFHAQIAYEERRFTIGDAITSISEKLLHRHPHVFGGASAENPKQVETLWEQAKAQDKPPQEALRSLPKGLPPLLRALRAGERMANMGFDWENPGQVMEKVSEEIGELTEVMDADDPEAIAHELGDLLFVLVQLARQLDVNPDDALNNTTDRAITRFGYVLKKLAEEGRTPKDSNLDEMEALWQKSKKEPGLE